MANMSHVSLDDALAIAFGFAFIFGVYLNMASLIAMPVMALGIGVDDMFVVIRYFFHTV